MWILNYAYSVSFLLLQFLFAGKLCSFLMVGDSGKDNQTIIHEEDDFISIDGRRSIFSFVCFGLSSVVAEQQAAGNG